MTLRSLVQRSCTSLAIGLLFAAVAANAAAQTAPARPPQRLEPRFGQAPLSFEANRGQSDDRVKYLAHGQRYSVFLTDRSAVFAFRDVDQTPSGSGKNNETPMTLELSGANPEARPDGLSPLDGTVNYFIGNDPAQWKAGISTFSRVQYKSVYPGIDLVFYGKERQLEFDLVAAPGANPAAIRLHIGGAEHLRLEPDGNLEIVDGSNRVALHRPTIYQAAAGKRRNVPGRYVLLGQNSVGFRIGRYDHAAPLVIDPILSFSTYLGGSTNDEADALASDAQGNLYIAGRTFSADFPVSAGAVQPTNHSAANKGENAFVTKLNPSGTAILYSTYLGGSGGGPIPGIAFGDGAQALAVDAEGNAYIAGYANSADFPVTKGAFQTKNYSAVEQYYTAFVAKLNPTGSKLVYSTFLGGNFYDVANGLAVNAAGDAYVTGTTLSTNFPVVAGAFQPTNHAIKGNAFITELNSAGSKLIFSTFLGGTNSEQSADIALDSDGNVYVTGETASSNFPTTKGAFQTVNKAVAHESTTAFVTKLSPDGTSLLYSTYLGGSGGPVGSGFAGDTGEALAVNANGDVFVTGYTQSTDFPVTPGAFQSKNKAAANNGFTVFVTRLNAEGSGLQYSTYLGGSDYELPGAIALDAANNAYLTGSTNSADFPVTANAIQPTNKGLANHDGNAFVSVLNATGSRLSFSTYLGGSGLKNNGGDIANGIALDASGNVYLAGATGSSNFPVTAGALQTVNRAKANQGSNAFISKISLATLPTSTLLSSTQNPQVVGKAVTFQVLVKGDAASTQWPTGNVVFTVDGKTAATVALNCRCDAKYTTSSLPVGAHGVSASYEGSALFSPSKASLTEDIKEPRTAAPVFSPAVGTYTGKKSVTLTSGTPGAVIYYTLNGSTPTSASTPYKAAIPVAATTTIRAIAIAPGELASPVVTGTYHIQ